MFWKKKEVEQEKNVVITVQILDLPPSKNPDDPFDPIEEVKNLKMYHTCGIGHIDIRHKYDEIIISCTGCERTERTNIEWIRSRLRRFFINHNAFDAPLYRGVYSHPDPLAHFSIIAKAPY